MHCTVPHGVQHPRSAPSHGLAAAVDAFATAATSSDAKASATAQSVAVLMSVNVSRKLEARCEFERRVVRMPQPQGEQAAAVLLRCREQKKQQFLICNITWMLLLERFRETLKLFRNRRFPSSHRRFPSSHRRFPSSHRGFSSSAMKRRAVNGPLRITLAIK